jgi:2,3-bisphosphoglycerate-dependent phosphoglycerate mutase
LSQSNRSQSAAHSAQRSPRGRPCSPVTSAAQFESPRKTTAGLPLTPKEFAPAAAEATAGGGDGVDATDDALLDDEAAAGSAAGRERRVRSDACSSIVCAAGCAAEPQAAQAAEPISASPRSWGHSFSMRVLGVGALLLASSSAYRLPGPSPSPVARAARSPAPRAAATPETHATLIFLRHGQSVWNEGNLFTGWADVELTTLGKNEAAQGATSMWQEGIKVDVAYTSLLTRARQTLDIVLKITGQEDVPVNSNWRLNERMYGGLTGLNKKETVAKYGEAQVKQWRRSYSTPPPPIDKSSEYWPGNDNKYAHIPDDEIPLSECLKDTVDRCLPYWKSDIMPALQRGKTVLVAAHGNSIRGMLKYLDEISDEVITGLEVPTGIPLVYRLDKNLKPIPSDRACEPLNGYFLVDPEELKKAQEKVANQSKLRYGEGEAK